MTASSQNSKTIFAKEIHPFKDSELMNVLKGDFNIKVLLSLSNFYITNNYNQHLTHKALWLMSNAQSLRPVTWTACSETCRDPNQGRIFLSREQGLLWLRHEPLQSLALCTLEEAASFDALLWINWWGVKFIVFALSHWKRFWLVST